MNNFKKRNILIVLSIMILFLTVGSVIAYLKSASSKVNTFEIGEVKSNISEEFDKVVKSDVFIENNGNVKEYVRVFINIYFTNNDGVIIDDVPIENVDYSITYSSSINWIYNSNDNFYYYKLPINPNESTDILISECRKLIDYDDKVLNVDILSQVIQAEPTSAVTSAWRVSVNNGSITIDD